jgi:hypothetical protein
MPWWAASNAWLLRQGSIPCDRIDQIGGKMSSFDLKRSQRDPEEWQEMALKKVGNNDLQMHVFGGFAIAATVAVTATPITGVIVAAYVVWSAIAKGRRQKTDFSAIREGCIAHIFEDGEFRAYLRQAGEEAVLAELNHAAEEGYELSADAEEFLENHLNQKALPAGRSKTMQSFDAVPDGIASTYDPTASEQIDLVAQMTDRVQNIFGVGQGGSGKGILMSNAMRSLKAKFPKKKIFLINGKDEPKEYGYFAGVVDRETRLHCETAKPHVVLEWFEKALAEYDEMSAKHSPDVGGDGVLLVIDEGTIIGKRLKDAKSDILNDRVIGIASCGGSGGRNIWVFAQTPFAGAGGMNLSSMSQMVKIVLVRSDAIGVLEEWKRASLFKKFDSTEVADLAEKSDCKRAIYWGGSAKWYSMPRLANHSGYDRDTGMLLPVTTDALNDTERSQLKQRTTTVVVDRVAKLLQIATKSRSQSLNDLIRKDLKSDATIELKKAIIKALHDRTDLLEKFNLGWTAIEDPIEALKFGGFANGTDDAIAEAWEIHTGQKLNEQGVKLLRDKLC